LPPGPFRRSPEPALARAGEEPIRISRDNFSLDTLHGALRLKAWSDRRNLVRRITGIDEESRGNLVLSIGHFGKRPGTLSLVDLRRPSGQDATLKSERLEFREQFRLFLRRQFPTHHNPGLTTEPDLEPSLSPAYPRALLRKGSQCWASHRRFVGSISLRTRADLRPHLTRLPTGQGTGPGVRGLMIYLPAGQGKLTCLRLPFLNPHAAQ